MSIKSCLIWVVILGFPLRGVIAGEPSLRRAEIRIGTLEYNVEEERRYVFRFDGKEEVYDQSFKAMLRRTSPWRNGIPGGLMEVGFITESGLKCEFQHRRNEAITRFFENHPDEAPAFVILEDGRDRRIEVSLRYPTPVCRVDIATEGGGRDVVWKTIPTEEGEIISSSNEQVVPEFGLAIVRFGTLEFAPDSGERCVFRADGSEETFSLMTKTDSSDRLESLPNLEEIGFRTKSGSQFEYGEESKGAYLVEFAKDHPNEIVEARIYQGLLTEPLELKLNGRTRVCRVDCRNSLTVWRNMPQTVGVGANDTYAK